MCALPKTRERRAVHHSLLDLQLSPGCTFLASTCIWCFGLGKAGLSFFWIMAAPKLQRSHCPDPFSATVVMLRIQMATACLYWCEFVLFVLFHNGLIRTRALPLAARGSGVRDSWSWRASSLSADACNYAQTCNRLLLQCSDVPCKRGVLLPARCHASATHKVAWASPGVTIPFERLL